MGSDNGSEKSMRQKAIFPSLSICILWPLIILTACSTFSGMPNSEVNDSMNDSQNNRQISDKPVYSDNGGKGITIAVPTPQMHNLTINDNWMPQFFQDLITGDLSRYSAMTVLDRLNEGHCSERLSGNRIFVYDSRRISAMAFITRQ